MYVNEVEDHLLNVSLSNNVNETWQHLNDIILNVGYQYYKRHVVGIRCLVFHITLGLKMNVRCISNGLSP